jgi:hypothetical protein
MRNNIATLQRELNAYILEGNDYMVEKIQSLIDNEIKRRDVHNLNEVVISNSDDNTINLNEG